MKFFKNNAALTLIELVISMTISSMIFVMVFVFMSDSIEELTDNNVKITSIESYFDFKDTLSRFIEWWYSDPLVFTWSSNDVLYLKNQDATEAIIIWIVNLKTKKIQQDYVFWDNFLWYRKISNLEMLEIDFDNNKILEKIFQNDKIFMWLRTKDFKLDLYNNYIINIYISLINIAENNKNWIPYDDFFIDNDNIVELNLVF